MSSIRGKMTPVELIKLAQDRITYVQNSGRLAFAIKRTPNRKTDEELYLISAIECLTDAIAELEGTKNETPRS